jgi:hypothetical protein
MRSPRYLSVSVCLYMSVSVHLSVYPHLILEAYENTLLSVCISPHISFVFYAVRVLSKKSRQLVLRRTSG